MYIAETTTAPPNTTCWNTDLTGWDGGNFDSVSTIVSEPKPAVDYWREISDKVSLPQHRHVLSSSSLPEAPMMKTPLSPSEKNGYKYLGIMPIFGPIYARSKLLRRAFNTLALLSIVANPLFAPRHTEASGTLAPFNQSYPICVGSERAKEMRHPLCAQGHGIFPCTKESLGNKFYPTSEVEGSRCEFTCVYRPGFLGIKGYHNDLTDVCMSSNDTWVTDLTGMDLSSDNSQPSNSTNTSGSFGGESDVPIPKYNGEVQPGGDGLCSFDLTGPVDQSDPDCTLGGLFGGGNSQSAPATENTAPPITEQVPNVPALANTTGTTEWQTPTTTGDSGGGESNNSDFGCEQRLRAQYKSPLQMVKLLKEIGLQCH